MKKLILVVLMSLLVIPGYSQQYSWKAHRMDGSRTGCQSPSKDNVDVTIGVFHKGKYIAPDGSVHKKNSAAAKAARIVLDAQPKMARVKDVIGYSPRSMTASYPESALSDWFVDLLMSKVEKLTGKKVDVGIANFGGIRVGMPEGDIILDDMLSMFPFKNQLVYVEHKGSEIRKVLETMAAHHFEVLGGVRVVAENGKLVSAEIGGKPIDDEKVYGVATISFLLDGGDGLTLRNNALSVECYKDVDIIDAVLEFVYAETAAGRPIEYKADGRVVIKDREDRRR